MSVVSGDCFVLFFSTLSPAVYPLCRHSSTLSSSILTAPDAACASDLSAEKRRWLNKGKALLFLLFLHFFYLSPSLSFLFSLPFFLPLALSCTLSLKLLMAVKCEFC